MTKFNTNEIGTLSKSVGGRWTRGSEDGERRGFGKEAYRLSRDAEEESDATTLVHLLETNF